ncbi:MAG TPA: signal peptidase I [Egibacteraceae bacterium]|nr:signal peptidase I [Egibacteraceae bacterium]
MDARPETTRRGAADWLVLVGRFAALVYLNALVWLSVWVLIPTLFMGWQPMAIETGSMGPSIRTGDVVLVESYRGQPLEAGRVITFRDPADPDRLVTHRITAVNADGTYLTKGDANLDADSTPLAGEHIRGVGRLVIPRVGLPVVWMEQGHYAALGAWAVSVVFALVLLAPSRPEEQPSRVPLSARVPRFPRRSAPAPVAPLPGPAVPVASLPVPPGGPSRTLPVAAGWAQVPAVRYRLRLPVPPMALELPAPPRWTVALVPSPPGTAPVAPIPAPPRPAAVRRGTALSSRDVPGWAGRLHS